MSRRILPVMLLLSFAPFALVLISCAKQNAGPPAATEAEQIAHGKYLVTVLGCHDCHTPGYFYGAPDSTRALSGSELGWQGPWGVSYPRNLTPDPQTGIGAWTEADIVKAIRTGMRPDGRMLLPPMPWPDLATLTDQDAAAVAKYLKTLPPVMHKVPELVPPGTKATGSILVLPQPSAWDAPRTATATH